MHSPGGVSFLFSAFIQIKAKTALSLVQFLTKIALN